jgi:hypothetical protein
MGRIALVCVSLWLSACVVPYSDPLAPIRRDVVPTPDPDRRARAEWLLAEGMNALYYGRLSEAVDSLEASNRILASPAANVYLAEAYQRRGEPRRAGHALRRFCELRSLDLDEREEADRALEALEAGDTQVSVGALLSAIRFRIAEEQLHATHVPAFVKNRRRFRSGVAIAVLGGAFAVAGVALVLSTSRCQNSESGMGCRIQFAIPGALFLAGSLPLFIAGGYNAVVGSRETERERQWLTPNERHRVGEGP